MKRYFLFLLFLAIVLIPPVSYSQDYGTGYGVIVQTFKETATPSTPPATYYKLYFKSDGKLYFKNSAGTETEVGSVESGTGDVTSVGDCASGACLDGSSDGGTYIRLYDGTSKYFQLGVGATLAGNMVLNFAGTMTNTYLCTYTSTGTIINCNTNPATFQPAGSYQATDADLTAIAALACTENQIIKRNGEGAWICGADNDTGGDNLGSAVYSDVVALWTTCTGYLKSDGTCDTPSGTIGGSTGSTDNRLLRSDGTGGATVQASAVTVDDDGNMSGVGTISAGAGGFTVDADGDAVAKSMTISKASGIAGEVQIYNDYLTETYGVIFKGPTGTMGSAYTLQYPNAAPTTGQVATYGTPMTWVIPVTTTGANIMGDGLSDQQIYLDATPASSGTWQGFKIAGTAGETIAPGQILYAKNASGTLKYYLYDADGTDKALYPRGIAIIGGNNGDSIAIGIGTGIFRLDGWSMTTDQDEGKAVYADDGTAGGITFTAPSDAGDKVCLLGFVLEENVIQFNFAGVCGEIPTP